MVSLCQFQQCLNNHKMKRGMKIEVVNKMCVSGMRVAVICDIVGGRLRLNYVDSKVSMSVGAVAWSVGILSPVNHKGLHSMVCVCMYGCVFSVCVCVCIYVCVGSQRFLV